jgi:hypothetical protein
VKFVKRVGDPHDGVQAQDIAKKLGLLYAAGVLGVRLGIAPWTAKDVQRAITICYRRARAMLVDDGQVLRTGLKTLRKALEALPLLMQDVPKTIQFDNTRGYRAAQRLGTQYSVIRVASFNQILPDARQRTLVQNWLLEFKHLAIRQSRGRNGAMVRKPKQQFLWPDGKRRRSFRIDRMP